MDVTNFLHEYEAALTTLAQAEVAVKVLEMRQKMVYSASQMAAAGQSEADIYLAENGEYLTHDEIEFANQSYATSSAVAELLDKSVSTVKRLCKTGELKSVVENKRYQIDPISVLRFKQHAETEEEIKRDLDRHR